MLVALPPSCNRNTLASKQQRSRLPMLKPIEMTPTHMSLVIGVQYCALSSGIQLRPMRELCAQTTPVLPIIHFLFQRLLHIEVNTHMSWCHVVEQMVFWSSRPRTIVTVLSVQYGKANVLSCENHAILQVRKLVETTQCILSSLWRVRRMRHIPP